MYPKRETVSLTTDVSGDATGYTSSAVRGRILSIAYVKDGSTPFADGVDFTITGEATGQTIWTEENVNASKTVAPRLATHSTAGVAALFAAGGTGVLGEHVWLAGERVKVVVASGGSAKLGSFVITWAAQGREAPPIASRDPQARRRPQRCPTSQADPRGERRRGSGAHRRRCGP